MGAGRPTVSLIVPVHNRSGELEQALESIRAQTFGDWEAIVVDDRSTDDAPSVIRRFASADARFRPIKLDPARHGAPAARNLGVEVSHAPYVMFFDSDDLLTRTALENRVAIMSDHPELDFGVFGCEMFHRTPGDTRLMWNIDTGEDDIDRFLRNDVPWQTTGPIWKKSSLARVGGWDEEVLSAQDWEFHIRALLAGLKYERFGPPDIYWRMAAADRDSIGKSQSIDPEYHLSRFALYRKMHGLMRDKGLLTPQRREMFAGMYFSACERLAKYVSRREGRKSWRVALEDGVITPKQHRDGWWVLILMRWPGRAAAAKRRLASIWPPQMLMPRSKTFMNTPARSLAEVPA